MTINELIKLIEQWAIDRGLDKNGTVEGQLIKTAEEVAELIIGISKDDIEVIKDSVGDVFVTLVVGNMLSRNFDFFEFYWQGFCAWHKDLYGRSIRPTIVITDSEDKLKVIHYLTRQIGDMDTFREYKEHICSGVIFGLLKVAALYDLDFVECVESAYKEISNRKGKVINGTFWKSEDLEKWEEE